MKSAQIKTAKPGHPRSGMLNMRIDPRLKYLAEITAREQARSLTGFMERAIRLALSKSFAEFEARSSHSLTDPEKDSLHNETLWDVDESDRFFKLATMRPGLLTISEQKLWKLFTMYAEHNRKKITITEFHRFWNNPAINTSHLEESESE